MVDGYWECLAGACGHGRHGMPPEEKVPAGEKVQVWRGRHAGTLTRPQMGLPKKKKKKRVCPKFLPPKITTPSCPPTPARAKWGPKCKPGGGGNANLELGNGGGRKLQNPPPCVGVIQVEGCVKSSPACLVQVFHLHGGGSQ